MLLSMVMCTSSPTQNHPLNHLPRRPPQRLRRPLRRTNHHTMPLPLTPFYNIKRTSLHLPRPLDHELRHRSREIRSVLNANQIRRRDMHPRRVGGGAEEDACAVGPERGG